MFRFSTFFRSHGFRYSTISAHRKPHLLVDYLMDSLRFSKQDAISVSSKAKVTHLKSTCNSDSVINVLITYGLDLSQIRKFVSSVPKILSCKANKTFEPKLRVFQELGLSGSDLVRLIKKHPEIFGYGLHTRILPSLNLLRKVVGRDEKVIEVINKSRWLTFTNYCMNRISTNVCLLHNLGLLNERITMFVVSNPDKVMVNPEMMQSRLSYVEEKLGISRDSPAFIHAVSVVLWCSDSKVEKKMQIFRSFGWSDLDIALLFMNQPYCLNKSESNIRDKLKFYMKDLGYTPSYLISCTSFFTFSLDKRIIPRNTMLKILKDKKLLKDKRSLISIACYSELKFLEFLRGFEDDIPSLREIYLDSVKKVS